MEEKKLQLSRDDFVTAAGKLYAKLSQAEREIILYTPVKRVHKEASMTGESFTFKVCFQHFCGKKLKKPPRKIAWDK